MENKMKNFQSYLSKKRAEHGNKFDDSNLSKQFIKFYESAQRIEVEYSYGETKEIQRGTVGVTTGWRPTFLLMRRISDHSSSYLLDDSVRIVKIVR